MTKILTDEQKIAARKRQKKYAEANKEKVLKASSTWNKKNKEKMLEAANRYLEKVKDNPDYKAKKAAITRSWAKNNPEKVVEMSAKKRCSKLKRMPSWLSVEQKVKIRSFYKVAQMMSTAFSVNYHVDHIVPLRGKLVSGLHVPWNLRVIKAEENMVKSNKFLLENSNG
jgi:hypothetical protein